MIDSTAYDAAVVADARARSHARTNPARAAYVVSAALAAEAAATSTLHFLDWGVLKSDTPMSVGNMRGTALTVLAIAIPLLVIAMRLAARGSARARYVWAGALAYIAYNSVLFCFGSHFSSFFLLLTTMLALSFWALLTLLTGLDVEWLRQASRRVPLKAVVAFSLVTVVLFAGLWLRDMVPGIIDNAQPASYEGTGLVTSPIHVLDFAFTFPVTLIGAVWLLRRRAWGYVVTGMMVIMVTIESAGIAIDQTFGHRHDPSQSLASVPMLLGYMAVGLVFTVLFLRSTCAATGEEQA